MSYRTRVVVVGRARDCYTVRTSGGNLARDILAGVTSAHVAQAMPVVAGEKHRVIDR